MLFYKFQHYEKIVIHEILFIVASGIGWVFHLQDGKLVRNDNDIFASFFSAIKSFAQCEGRWHNNIEYISWVRGYSIISSCEGKFTLIFSIDKSDSVDMAFDCLEYIREQIMDRYGNMVSSDWFFNESTNIINNIVPIIENALQKYGMR